MKLLKIIMSSIAMLSAGQAIAVTVSGTYSGNLLYIEIPTSSIPSLSDGNSHIYNYFYSQSTAVLALDPEFTQNIQHWEYLPSGDLLDDWANYANITSSETYLPRGFVGTFTTTANAYNYPGIGTLFSPAPDGQGYLATLADPPRMSVWIFNNQDIGRFDYWFSISMVPEPTTWALTLCGLGFLGFILRLRRHMLGLGGANRASIHEPPSL